MNDGGSAFPHDELVDRSELRAKIYVAETGMSLRDYFAGEAIKGVLSVCRGDTPKPSESPPEMFARKAFELADAMIVAREKQH